MRGSAWTRVCSKASRGKEGKEEGGGEGRDFLEHAMFLSASKQNPRTPIGARSLVVTRVREKCVEDPEENH